MKILIIKMSSLGDVIHTLPLVNILKKNIPNAVIDWVVNEEYAPILNGNPNLNQIYKFKRKDWLGITGLFSKKGEIKAFADSLKNANYDFVIDVQGLFKSAIVASMTKCKHILGYSNAREFAPFFYTEKIAGNYNLHAVERYLQFADYLKISWQKSELDFYIPVSEQDKNTADILLKENALEASKYAVFCPFSRWKTKMWSEENFFELSKMLNQDGIKTVWTGSKNESLKTEVSNNFIGKLSINQLQYLMTKSNFVVTCDSGAMHIAAAANAKIFAIFGPTSEKRTGPYCIKIEPIIIRKNNLDCAPCFKKRCDKNNECLKISAKQVYDTILEEQKL